MSSVSVDGFTINDSITFSSERPALLLLTSGTTGAPKGVVHTRRFFYYGQGFAEPCLPTDVFPLIRPVSWVSSMRRITEMLQCGGTIVIMDQTISTRPEAVWALVRKGGFTVVSLTSLDWRQLMVYYERTLSSLPVHTRIEYVRGLKSLRVLQCVGWMPPPLVKAFWERLLDGRALEVAYASTEAGTVIASTTSAMIDHEIVNSLPPSTEMLLMRQACIGRPLPGMKMKLSNGTKGEILVKTPTMYLNDDGSTQAVFEEGYFRSGDMAHLRGDGCYLIGGRAKTDFARFVGLHIPLIEVESAVAQLPYVDEAYILAVPDCDTQTRVGALLRVKSGWKDLTLETLRKDLSTGLSTYKLPTLLYLLQGDEQVPRTLSGKLSIKETLRMFFACSGDHWTVKLPERVEKWDLSVLKKERKRAWDWSGLQVMAVWRAWQG
ncbi:ANL family adenylate-forming protein [Aspergillus melleus]|uniref:ANL family adenylate-forming protein n=1 Tax=Aspergillus melleus TaxID=138277 RepID=UPI001E8CABF6|nr:uncharacterized protein LDX57_010590 [Aspergillus melleus]KAH8432956.1 hypothetical protein LDX57_010590 [Aspergillus melleus]